MEPHAKMNGSTQQARIKPKPNANTHRSHKPNRGKYANIDKPNEKPEIL